MTRQSRWQERQAAKKRNWEKVQRELFFIKDKQKSEKQKLINQAK